MEIQQQQLQEALNLVANGTTEMWEYGYYARLKGAMLEESPAFPVFEYTYKDRNILYSHCHEAIVRNAPMDFFEFGVFRGDSFRQWMQLNTHSESRFFGFDSFEGLPERWEAGDMEAGHFSTDGNLPKISDPRGSFIKGFFNDSLRPFLDTYKPKNKMVIHVDADLCSSSLYAMMTMDPFIKRGTLIVFDDFGPADEFAAFHHYTKSCMRTWKTVAARNDYHKYAVVITN